MSEAYTPALHISGALVAAILLHLQPCSDCEVKGAQVDEQGCETAGLI